MSATVNTLSNKILIEPNSKYNLIGETTILLENTAENVVYRSEGVQSKTSNQFTFTLDINDHFLDRSIYLNLSAIPLIVNNLDFNSVATPNINKLTDYTFISGFFNNYADVCLKQFSFLNAIQSIECTIDGLTISSATVDEILPINSNYYDTDQVHQFLDASLPDKCYSHLAGDGIPFIPTISVGGNKIYVKNSTLSATDPFSSCASQKYNSRNPVFKLGNHIATEKKLTCTLENITTYLPFNLFGIPGDDIPLYNGNKMKVSINLHPNWVNRIFSCKKSATAGSTDSSKYNFTLDNSQLSANSTVDITLNAKLYNPPQYIRDQLNNKAPYILNYPKIELDTRSTDITFSATDTTKSVISTPFDIRAIPKRIYIAVVPKRQNDNDYLTETNHFCRLENLSIELNGATTDIAVGKGSENLYQIAKENGLNVSKEEALYLKGFPLCIDISNNLSVKTNSLVGMNNNASGKYTLRVKTNVTRLQQDGISSTMAEANFTQLSKVYEMKVIFVYTAFFCCNMFGQKFSILESLDMDKAASLDAHLVDIYSNIMPRMNIIGGSWFTETLGPFVKKAVSGVGRLVKAAISNNNGFRDSLIREFNGDPVNYVEQRNGNGGNFNDHVPVLGGMVSYKQQSHNITGGKPISKWNHQ